MLFEAYFYQLMFLRHDDFQHKWKMMVDKGYDTNNGISNE